MRYKVSVVPLFVSFLLGSCILYSSADDIQPYPIVSAITWSHDGATVAFGYIDGRIELHNTAEQTSTALTERHDGKVNVLAFSPEDDRLLSASGDGSVFIWDITTGDRLNTLPNHGEPVTAAAWSSDGLQVYTGISGFNTSPSLRVWDVRSGERVAGHSPGSVDYMRVDPKTGNILVAAFSSVVVLEPRELYGIMRIDLHPVTCPQKVEPVGVRVQS